VKSSSLDLVAKRLVRKKEKSHRQEERIQRPKIYEAKGFSTDKGCKKYLGIFLTTKPCERGATFPKTSARNSSATRQTLTAKAPAKMGELSLIIVHKRQRSFVTSIPF
jgi:hypothetical protein